MDRKELMEQGRTEESLWDYVRIVTRHWKLEIGIFLAGCLIAVTYSLHLPNIYEATASVLPPQESGGGRALLSSIATQPGMDAITSAFMPNLSGSKDTFVGILKSRTMLDDVIKKFDLVKVYGVDGSKAPMRNARAMLEDATDIRISREGVISITASTHDPKVAADVANFFVDNLDRLNTTINVTEAGRSRLFLEGRVIEAQKALHAAEDRLKVYQSQSKAVVMEGQTKAAIEGAARLEGQILAAEVQMKTLETYSTPRNPDVIKLKEGIEEMRRQLKRMEYGRETGGKGKEKTTDGNEMATDGGNRGADFAVALGSIPATVIELARLIRDAKMQETIFTLLTQQLEQAKIAAARDTSTVRILDRALPPEWKSRPSIARNTVMGGVFSLFVGIVLAFVLEGMERARARKREVAGP
jgi:tyrosine-protein kinase Etk/Wzc